MSLMGVTHPCKVSTEGYMVLNQPDADSSSTVKAAAHVIITAEALVHLADAPLQRRQACAAPVQSASR